MTMPRFLADGEGITSCANNLIGKHFEFFHTALQIQLETFGVIRVKFEFF